MPSTSIDRALLQMVLQIAPDAGAIEHGLDAERRQPVGRPDAGAMQHLDRSDRACRQDHFAFGAGLDRLAALDKTHADRAAVFDDQPVDQHVLFQPQVLPVQHRFKKTARRRPAPAALLVDVEIADALIVAGVEVRRFPNAHLLRREADRVQHRPGQPGRLDPPAAAGAVMFAVPEEMILQPPERRQHVVPAPAGQPKLAPMVVVGGLSPHRDHGVDGRGAADHLAARIGQRAAVEAGLRLRSGTSSRSGDCRSRRDSRPGCGTRSSCRCRRPPGSGRGC